MSRFPVLRTIALLLKGFAALAVLIGVVVALTQDGAAMKIAFLAGALLYGVVLWAFSELISVALSIESNTYLTQQSLTAKPAPAVDSTPLFSSPKPDVSNRPYSPLNTPPAPPPTPPKPRAS
jgi:hypothetical protein